MRDYNHAEFEKFSEDISKWTRDEIYPYWSDEERIRVSEIFGNVEPGVLYRGLKVDNEEDFKLWMDILEGRSSEFDFGRRMVSATPERFEAKTFMEYTKSYHPMIMAEGMRELSERGCAGKYASVLVKFEIEKENVLWTNYKNGDEDNSHIPESTAETEAFITGKIKVLDIVMQLPLNKDNYIQRILDAVEEPTDMNIPGYKMWISSNLNEDEAFEVLVEVIEKFKRNNQMKDLIEFMFSEKFSSLVPFNDRLFEHFSEFESYLRANVKFESDFVGLYIEGKEDRIGINKYFGEVNFSRKFAHIFKEEIVEIIDNFESDAEVEISPYVLYSSEPPKFSRLYHHDFLNDDYRRFLRLYNLSESNTEFKEKLYNCSYYRKNQDIIVDYIENHILENDLEPMDKLDLYSEFLYTIDKLDLFLEGQAELVDELFKFFYYQIPTGSIENMDFLNKFSKDILPRAFQVLTPLMKKSDNNINKNKNDNRNKNSNNNV